MTIHPSWIKVGGIPLEIMEGKHDDLLETIQDACQKRQKSRFRKGDRFKLTGTKNAEIEGKICTVMKVNPKRVTVGIGDPKTEYGVKYYPDGELNVPPRMLTAV